MKRGVETIPMSFLLCISNYLPILGGLGLLIAKFKEKNTSSGKFMWRVSLSPI